MRHRLKAALLGLLVFGGTLSGTASAATDAADGCYARPKHAAHRYVKIDNLINTTFRFYSNNGNFGWNSLCEKWEEYDKGHFKRHESSTDGHSYTSFGGPLAGGSLEYFYRPPGSSFWYREGEITWG